jgi:hypothetical protein
MKSQAGMKSNLRSTKKDPLDITRNNFLPGWLGAGHMLIGMNANECPASDRETA